MRFEEERRAGKKSSGRLVQFFLLSFISHVLQHSLMCHLSCPLVDLIYCWSDVTCYVNFISGDCPLVFDFKVLHGATLEGHLKASAGAEYGCMDSYMCL